MKKDTSNNKNKKDKTNKKQPDIFNGNGQCIRH